MDMQPASPAQPPHPAYAPYAHPPHAPYRPAPQAGPGVVRGRPRPKAFGTRELVALLGAVAVVDVGLWADGQATAGGLGVALLMLGVPAAIAVGATRVRRSGRLAALAAMLVVVAAKCAFEPTAGAALAGLALGFMVVLSLRARRSFLPDAFLSFFSGVGKLPSRLEAAARGTSRLLSRTRLGRVSVLPVVVPIALTAVFAGVFAFANPVVARAVGTVAEALGRWLVVPSFGRVALWVFTAVAACSLLRPALRLAKDRETKTEAETSAEASPTSLLTARNALLALNVLFFAYHALDATYLWSGAPPAGMHTQQYAHEGAFWLTVALVMLTGVIGFMFRGALGHDPRAHAVRVLAYAWMGQGALLALGTYRRMAIHIAHSGLSDLRIVGILGTTLVAFGLGTVALKLRRGHTLTWLVRRQLDALGVALVVYAATPTHLVAASVNVARIESGENGPLLHMFRQSARAESAPQLLPLLQHPDARVRQGVAVLLDGERETLQMRAAQSRSWRERDLASRRALRALEAASPTIDALRDAAPADARNVLLAMSRAAAE